MDFWLLLHGFENDLFKVWFCVFCWSITCGGVITLLSLEDLFHIFELACLFTFVFVRFKFEYTLYWSSLRFDSADVTTKSLELSLSELRLIDGFPDWYLFIMTRC